MKNSSIRTLVENYLKEYPAEAGDLMQLTDQLALSNELIDRKNFKGHVTGGALVFDIQGRILLVFHKSLGRWLQPGGHTETGEMPMETARREAFEETGIEAELNPYHLGHPLPFDIDTHPIPANPKKNEPGHYHHDFRYLFLAKSNQVNMNENEIESFGWFHLSQAKKLMSNFPWGKLENALALK